MKLRCQEEELRKINQQNGQLEQIERKSHAASENAREEHEVAVQMLRQRGSRQNCMCSGK